MGSIQLSLVHSTMAAPLVLLTLATAEASYFLGGGVALHPGHAVSSTQRSPQGLSVGYGLDHGYGGYGKREAEPSYGIGLYRGVGLGAFSYHPDGGVHSEARSPQGYGKREAEPSISYGVALHPTRVSSPQRSVQGLGLGYSGYGGYGYGYGIGKRSA